MNAVLVGVCVYLILQVVVGVWISRRIASEDDYLVGGRRLGPWVCAFSVFATWFGAETCITAAGETYRRGLVAATTDPLGYGIAVVVIGALIAAPIRALGLTTVADLYRQRFGIGVERLAVLLMVPTSVLWAAAQVRAFGQVLGAVGGLDTVIAITVAALVVVVYTLYGGLLADTFTDMVQGIVLIVGLAILSWFILRQGDLAVVAELPRERLTLLPAEDPWLAHAERWAIPVLGSLTAQEILSRSLAARTPRVARNATIAGGLLFIAVGLMPVLLGLVGWHLLPGLEEPDQILLHQAQQYLPTLLYVVFAGALVSAILSTVDSALLVAGSLTAHNVLIPLRQDMAGSSKLRLNRVVVALFGLVAYGLALSAESVFSLVEESAAFGTAGIFVAFAFALWGGWGGKWAASAALLLGAMVYQFGSRFEELVPYPYLSALLISTLAYLAVGWMEERSADRSAEVVAP